MGYHERDDAETHVVNVNQLLMSTLSTIRPTHPQRLIDLVKAAGVDVSDWQNCKGGKVYAARNPKYCYEWAFVDKKVVVLNLWYDAMDERSDGVVFIEMNPRKFALQRSGIETVRALRTDEAIKTAMKENLPIRVIVLEGKRRDIGDPKAGASRVSKRLLDPITWAVTEYDWKNGRSVLTRGCQSGNTRKVSENALDDLSDIPEGSDFPDRAKVISQVIKRDPRVRTFVLKRANGRCEHCGVRGFPTTNGGFYVEAHHIIYLSDSGRDTVDNVIALCPDHHRQAHYGMDAESLEAEFINALKKLKKKI